MNKFIVYTDGSCRRNGYVGAVGAHGYIILCEDELYKEYADWNENSTNQREELQAIIEACKYIMDTVDTGFFTVDIYTDSAYAHNCFTKRWYKKWQTNGWVNSKNAKVANQDLWKELIPFFEDPRFNFKKVKGHADDKWNNKVDCMVQNLTQEKMNG